MSGIAIDPVCKMEVKIDQAPAVGEYAGKSYYFCMQGCKDSFLAEPSKYLDSTPPKKGFFNFLKG